MNMRESRPAQDLFWDTFHAENTREQSILNALHIVVADQLSAMIRKHCAPFYENRTDARSCFRSTAEPIIRFFVHDHHTKICHKYSVLSALLCQGISERISNALAMEQDTSQKKVNLFLQLQNPCVSAVCC